MRAGGGVHDVRISARDRVITSGKKKNSTFIALTSPSKRKPSFCFSCSSLKLMYEGMRSTYSFSNMLVSVLVSVMEVVVPTLGVSGLVEPASMLVLVLVLLVPLLVCERRVGVVSARIVLILSAVALLIVLVLDKMEFRPDDVNTLDRPGEVRTSPLPYIPLTLPVLLVLVLLTDRLVLLPLKLLLVF